ncbi:Hsp20/alpha crystallin family protein, partial [Candidatus Azambacteria bacterium]|nr:Hsp20/alpha crystallin family protein [Candidatus Azambacteria bacterium]
MDTKKSFFEKITGTKSVIDSAPEIRTQFNTEGQKSAPQAPQPNIAKEIHIKPDIQNTPNKEPEKTKKEAMQETEGQLVLDVYQDENSIIVKSTLAGVKPEDVDITMTNDMLSIKGVREKEEEIKEDDYYYQECYWGAFSRSVIIPVA